MVVERRHARVIDQDVDLAEALVSGIGQRLELVPIADMAAVRQGLAPEALLHILRQRLAVVELATRDDDIGSVLGESEHHLAAHPATAPGHQRDLAR